MAVRSKVSSNPNSWWDDAYKNHPTITAGFEYKFENDILTPGVKFRIKNKRGEFKFRCVATNSVNGKIWIDCIEVGSAFRSFYPSQIRNVVKPRRVKRKRLVKV
jgi:hypothetical protein